MVEQAQTDLEKEFNAKADAVRNLESGPGNDKLLELYGLFKQSTVGDVNTARPGMLDMKGKSKWDAWNSRKGLSKEDAMKAYIEVAQGLIDTIGLKP